MITVICPVYNEEAYVAGLIRFFITAEPVDKELILIDGGSTDNTVKIIEQFIADKHPVKLLSNPEKYVPFSLNLAIASSSGDPIIRLDAHTKYAPDYFVKVLETFNATGADIVGGPMRIDSHNNFQRATGYCTSTKFGVGDSNFHDDNFRGETESVYLGSWRRSVFNDVGYFDTEMLRNQDDEFHYRAKNKGKRIYLNPDIRCWYYPRSDFKSLTRQYFQYGLFKPLVLKKVRSGLRLRHLIPTMFVMYLLLIIPAVAYINSLALLPLMMYLIIDVIFSFRYKGSFSEKVLCLLIYPALHISYGTGFICGMLDHPRNFMR